MSDATPKGADRLRSALAETINAHWKLFLLQGMVMMTLGLIAVGAPQVATLAIDILVGWLFVVGGLFRAVTVFRSRGTPGFWFSLLTALLAMLLGLILLAQPGAGALTLTAALTVVFLAEGIGAILIALRQRGHLRNWRWTLLSGLVNLLLAVLIWLGWPATADWMIGLLVGINMFIFGLSLVMTALAARDIGIR